MIARIYTLVLVVLAVFATLLCFSHIAGQRDTLSVLNASASQGAREKAEYDTIAKVHDSVLSKPYFKTGEFATFSEGARAEQMNAYFGKARSDAENVAINGFWFPGYRDKARVALKKSSQADRTYSQMFPTLITASTIDDACSGQRFTAAQWLTQYNAITPDSLDELRAKVQTEIQQQTTAADCTLIAKQKDTANKNE